MKDFWRTLADRLTDGDPVFLVLVAGSTPGSPGTPGAKMFVRADGSQVGTIGGGVMELNLIATARDALASGEFPTQLQTLHHRRTGPGEKSGKICAGSQTNLYRICRPGADAETIREAARAVDEERPSVLVVTPDTFSVVETPVDGSVPAVRLEVTDDTWRYEEDLLNRKRVSIIGSGHCGLALSRVLEGLGYDVAVYDTRPDVETFVTNDYAGFRQTVSDYEDVGALLRRPECTAVVVMTTDYPSDVKALKGVLGTPAPYVGVMGSKAKVHRIKSDLREAGFDDVALEKLRIPIGLPIGSHTPQEIAISIAAELIALEAGPGAGRASTA